MALNIGLGKTTEFLKKTSTKLKEIGSKEITVASLKDFGRKLFGKKIQDVVAPTVEESFLRAEEQEIPAIQNTMQEEVSVLQMHDETPEKSVDEKIADMREELRREFSMLMNEKVEHALMEKDQVIQQLKKENEQLKAQLGTSSISEETTVPQQEMNPVAEEDVPQLSFDKESIEKFREHLNERNQFSKKQGSVEFMDITEEKMKTLTETVPSQSTIEKPISPKEEGSVAVMDAPKEEKEQNSVEAFRQRLIDRNIFPTEETTGIEVLEIDESLYGERIELPATGQLTTDPSGEDHLENRKNYHLPRGIFNLYDKYVQRKPLDEAFQKDNGIELKKEWHDILTILEKDTGYIGVNGVEGKVLIQNSRKYIDEAQRAYDIFVVIQNLDTYALIAESPSVLAIQKDREYARYIDSKVQGSAY